MNRIKHLLKDLAILIRANLWLIPVIAALVAAVFYFVAPPPPMSATMATGAEGGGYAVFAGKLREKLKEQKRQEKQKRKDERKSGGTSSFEDMIAYVDENGILHTTPQDVKPKTEIDVSQIEISTPKQEEMEILPSTGRVEYFTASKGYGFIKDADSGEKYFFHISSAPDTIAEGDKVTFEIERGTRGLAAVRISIINKQ